MDKEYKNCIDSAPKAPLMLSLTQLSKKTKIPYERLKRMASDGLFPVVRVGAITYVIYSKFLECIEGGKEYES